MNFKETSLGGAYLIEPKRFADQRGFLMTIFDQRDFTRWDLCGDFVQTNLSFTNRKGTLRGMHFQLPPKAQVKLVRCTRGAIYDVIIDLRPGSSTYREWYGAELSEENGAALYVPAGFAHGFQTLMDNSAVFYQLGEFYSPAHEGGVRWNDPAFSIQWPIAGAFVNERDGSYPDFVPRH